MPTLWSAAPVAAFGYVATRGVIQEREAKRQPKAPTGRRSPKSN